MLTNRRHFMTLTGFGLSALSIEGLLNSFDETAPTAEFLVNFSYSIGEFDNKDRTTMLSFAQGFVDRKKSALGSKKLELSDLLVTEYFVSLLNETNAPVVMHNPETRLSVGPVAAVA